MKSKVGVILIVVLVGVIVTACGPSESEISTRVAVAIAQTLDAFTMTPSPTGTPTATLTTSPRPSSTSSKTASPTLTPTVSNTPTETNTPGPSLTPTNTPTITKTPTSTGTPTPDPLLLDFNDLCAFVAKMTNIEQRAWSQKNQGRKVGLWRGRVIYFFPGDSVFFHVDGHGEYPFGSNVNFSFPKKTYLINQVYDFSGALIIITGDGSGCLAGIRADSRESQNKIVVP